MPKNLKGGNKAKSQKNSSGPIKNRDIPVPESEDNSHVAIITKVQGDSRYLCQIVNSDGIQPDIYPINLSKGTKNKYGRGIIISCGTYVLISIREFQKDKGDIIFVYRDSELNYLINNNYIVIDKTNTALHEVEFSEYTSNNQESCVQSDDNLDGIEFSTI
jgi:hypothetical protein